MVHTAAEFIAECSEHGIGIKSALLEYAATQRALRVSRFDHQTVFIEAPKAGPLAFRNMNGPLSASVGKTVCDRKDYARRILEARGLSVVPSQLFERGKRRAAWRYAQSLGLPVVLKPPGMARGRGVTTAIQTWEQFAEAWKKAMHAYRRPEVAQFLVEKHVYGEDYRVFVVDGDIFSATHRRRASVEGDGKSVVAELIDQKNRFRRGNPYLAEHLIPTSVEELDQLSGSGYSLETIPADGEQVVLRGASNLSAGGDSIDVTDMMHSSLKDVARRAVAAVPGMEYAGVDIIARSVTDPASPENHVVSEVEYSPAPITNFPVEGASRDMAGAILDFYLQRYGRRRWPSLRTGARRTR